MNKNHFSGKRILVIVPAYNEEQSISRVLGNLRRHAPFAEVLVVDDGSQDNTAAEARAGGATVLVLPFNLGIGGAMQTGYKYAQENNYDICVQYDGDGQHDASYIPLLISNLLEGSADVIIGSRYLGKNNTHQTPLVRRLGTFLFSRIISLILQQKITDATSGFRSLSKRALEICARNYPSDYPEVEILPIFHYARLKVREIPVDMKERAGGRSSITWPQAIYYMVKVVLAIFVGTLRRKEDTRYKMQDTSGK